LLFHISTVSLRSLSSNYSYIPYQHQCSLVCRSYKHVKYGHLIMSFESHKWSEKCTRSDLRESKVQKFPGDMPSDLPRGSTAMHSFFLPPPNFLEVLLNPSLSIFLNETLLWMYQALLQCPTWPQHSPNLESFQDPLQGL